MLPSPTENRSVVLVHGLFRQSAVFRKLVAALEREGFTVFAPNLKSERAQLGLENMAAQLAAFIDRALPKTCPFSLVGLSMGGLVARYYLQQLGGRDRVNCFVTIATPHYGTHLARLLPHKTIAQMRPGSAFLEQLNRDLGVLSKIPIAFLWTTWDFIVVPSENARLPWGREVKLNIFAHAMMVRDDRAIAAAIAILETRSS